MYLAHTPSQQPVALKVFKTHKSSQKELEIASAICDIGLKGIIKVLDFGINRDRAVAGRLEALPNSIFIVYEHVEKTLKSLWDNPRVNFSRQDIIQIGCELVDNVQRIHGTGYVHLDLKLDNILITRDNRVIIIDYGQAEKYKLKDGSHRPMGETGTCGNIHFGSPNSL